MAHSLSAKKRIRQAAKRNARNRARKVEIKESSKALNTAITAGDLDKAEQEFRSAVSTLSRVADRGTIHKNTAARRRSRMAKKLNTAKAGAGTPAAKA